MRDEGMDDMPGMGPAHSRSLKREDIDVHQGCVIFPSRKDFEDYAKAHRDDTGTEPGDREAARGSFLDYIRRIKGSELGLPTPQVIPAAQPITVVMDFALLQGANLAEGIFYGATFINTDQADQDNLKGAFLGPRDMLDRQLSQLKLAKTPSEALSLHQAIDASLSQSWTEAARTLWPWSTSPNLTTAEGVRAWFKTPKIKPVLLKMITDELFEKAIFKHKELSFLPSLQAHVDVFINDLAGKVAQEFARGYITSLLEIPVTGLPAKMLKAAITTAVTDFGGVVVHDPKFHKISTYRARGEAMAEVSKAISSYPDACCYSGEESEIKAEELRLKKKAVFMAAIGLTAVADPVLSAVPGIGSLLSWLSTVARTTIYANASSVALNSVQNTLTITRAGASVFEDLAKIENTAGNVFELGSNAIPDTVVAAVERVCGSDSLLELGKIAEGVAGPLSIAFACHQMSRAASAANLGLFGAVANTVLAVPKMLSLAAAANNAIETYRVICSERSKTKFFQRLSPAHPAFEQKVKARMFLRKMGLGCAVVLGLAAAAMATSVMLPVGVGLLTAVTHSVAAHWFISAVCSVPAILTLGTVCNYAQSVVQMAFKARHVTGSRPAVGGEDGVRAKQQIPETGASNTARRVAKVVNFHSSGRRAIADLLRVGPKPHVDHAKSITSDTPDHHK